MSRHRRISVVVLLSILAPMGCASARSGPKFADAKLPPLAPDKARIIFYRYGGEADGADTYGSGKLSVDGQSVGELNYREFLIVDRPPGPRKVSCKGFYHSYNHTMELAAGETYYIKISGNRFLDGMWGNPETQAAALPDLSNCVFVGKGPG